ncbi:hypothetical protein NGRA_1679 [Nosema granulosis]|uniref:Ras-GEF domain-containing protein n=1 Tax=Nosema granulosis TaxID=83296 RepID=A0A9P6KZC6_9MICR|nr:hypothetical protein NGRA_1679 [Nosema granulosis]
MAHEEEIFAFLSKCYAKEDIKNIHNSPTNMDTTTTYLNTNNTTEILPLSYYISKSKLSSARKAEGIDLLSIPPKKLARLLTDLDILFISRINPTELVEYDGTPKKNHPNISYLKNKNTGLINFFSSFLRSAKNHKYFLRVMKHLKTLRNLNSLECISKAFRTQKLSQSITQEINKEADDSYFSLRQKVDFYSTEPEVFIYPFDFFLKDVEDSNLNINQEDAAERFCRLMEMLIFLQNNLKSERRLKNKYEHFFFYNIQKFIRGEGDAGEEVYENVEGAFLIL